MRYQSNNFIIFDARVVPAGGLSQMRPIRNFGIVLGVDSLDDKMSMKKKRKR